MLNWLLRPGANKVEGFTKQMALSVPFMVNFNILGNFTKIQNFVIDAGLNGTLQVMPQVLTEFASTQSLTIVLQTLFYQIFITNGIRALETLQKTVNNELAARTITKYLAIPVLALDAVFFAMASSGTGDVLFNIGPMVVNTGHAALAALTMVGIPIAKWPQILQPTVKTYRMATSRLIRKKIKRNCVSAIEGFF